jgi:hypothetical protein
MEIVKPFENYNFRACVSPSKRIETEYGQIYINFKKIDNIRWDGFRPNNNLVFPYGLNSISQSGSLPSEHGFFEIDLKREIDDQENRQHFKLTMYLPKIGGKAFAPDYYSNNYYSINSLDFNLFVLESKLKSFKKEKEKNELLLFPESGLLTIPYDKKLLRGIELTIDKISLEEWKQYSNSFREVYDKIQKSLVEEQKRNHEAIPEMSIKRQKEITFD